MNKHVSDEQLNAYLDGELDTEDRLNLMDALRSDPDLANRVCHPAILLRCVWRLVCQSPVQPDTQPARNRPHGQLQPCQ